LARILFERFSTGVRWANWLAVALASAILVFIAVAVAYEVFARYVLRSPSRWTYEITGYALVWCVFLSAGHALSQGAHVYVDILYDRLPPLLARLTNILTSVVGLGFCGFVFWYGVNMTHVAQLIGQQSPTPLRFPMQYAYAAVPVGMVFLILEFLRRLLAELFDPAQTVAEAGK
jgi:TRAP-type C4-dicarboxylate transport system permease small subunit